MKKPSDRVGPRRAKRGRRVRGGGGARAPPGGARGGPPPPSRRAPPAGPPPPGPAPPAATGAHAPRGPARPPAPAQALALIRVRAPVARNLGDYQLHPALLDSCLQVHQGTLPFAGADHLDAGTYVPCRAERVRWYRPLAPGLADAPDVPLRFYCHFLT